MFDFLIFFSIKVPATIEALPEIVAAVKSLNAQDKVDIYLDGGVRKGTDVFKVYYLYFSYCSYFYLFFSSYSHYQLERKLCF